jgi:hypothetical protein
LFGCHQQSLQLALLELAAIRNDRRNAGGIGDRHQGIGIEQNHIRQLADLDRPPATVPARKRLRVLLLGAMASRSSSTCAGWDHARPATCCWVSDERTA